MRKHTFIGLVVLLLTLTYGVNVSAESIVDDLIIDPDVAAENMRVETRSGLRPIVKQREGMITEGGMGAKVDNYRTRFYDAFRGTHSQALIYNNHRVFNPGDRLRHNGVDEVITVTYDHIGQINKGSKTNPEYVDVGAKMVLSNIHLGAGPRWTEARPALDISNNFFSGILYQYIEKMDAEFTFFEKGNPNRLISFDDKKGVLSFLSLNGYGKVPLELEPWGLSIVKYPTRQREVYYSELTYEFVGSLDNVPGILSEGSLLDFHRRGSKQISNNSYYMDRGYGPSNNPDIQHMPEEYVFTDYLGGETYHHSGVTFPLSGTTHRFKIGSTYGYTWNSFMSSSVRHVEQDLPTKTVQPLKNKAGQDSGYNNRYDNDLDRYHQHKDGVNHDDKLGGKHETVKDQIESYWDLSPHYWQANHNPNDLAVEEIIKRYQKTGEEFYYFINQSAISIFRNSLVLPNKVVIKDKLPEGVELATKTKADLTLYNIDGKVLPLADSEWSYNPTTREIQVTLTAGKGSNLEKVNEKSRKLEVGDLSLRIKSKVNKLAEGHIDKDSMTNYAHTEFSYPSKTYETRTNKVQTAVRQLFVEKKWEEGADSLKKYRPDEISFTLEKEGANGWEKVETFKLTKKDEWKKVIDSTLIGSGNYRVREVDSGIHYFDSYDKAGHTDLTILNRMLTSNLKFKKESTTGQALTGAEFELYKYDEEKKEYSKLEKEIKAEESIYTIDNLVAGKYLIKEVKAPQGYIVSDKSYEFEIKREGDELKRIFTDAWKNNSIIENKLKPFDLSFEKTDNQGNALEGVEFTLENIETKEKVSTQSEPSGKVLFSNIKPGEYILSETKSLPGYEMLDYDIKLKIDGQGKVTFDAPIELNEQVDLREKGNNTIHIQTPIVNTASLYKLIIKKVDKDTGETLPGAKFTLEDDQNVVLYEALITDDDGTIELTDLAMGDYYLTETKAPDGYSLLKKPIKISIVGEEKEVVVTVENRKQGWSLPESGGEGPLIYFLLGIALILSSVLLIIRRRWA